MKSRNSLVARRQEPLGPLYREDPSKALSHKEVRTLYTGSTDAVHGRVVPTGFPEVAWDYGIDDKVGASTTSPIPGICSARRLRPAWTARCV